MIVLIAPQDRVLFRGSTHISVSTSGTPYQADNEKKKLLELILKRSTLGLQLPIRENHEKRRPYLKCV